MRLQERMQPPELLGEWLPLLVHGSTEDELQTSLTTAKTELERAQKAGEISGILPAGNAGTQSSLSNAKFPRPKRAGCHEGSSAKDR